MDKILFKTDTVGFSKDLHKTINDTFTKVDIKKAVRFLWFKLFFYLSSFLLSITFLYMNTYADHLGYLILNYLCIGVSGILLAFNSSHDIMIFTLSFQFKKLWKIITNFIFLNFHQTKTSNSWSINNRR